MKTAENDATDREHVSLKGFSLPLKPCRQNDALYKHTREDCDWGIKLEEYILFKYFTGTKSERGLALMKYGFRAAGVHEIKAKFRQLILEEALRL